MRSLDVQLLAWAHDKVQPLVGADPERVDKYRSAVKGAPAFVQGCGLAQAVAFWLSKASREDSEAHAYRALLDHLESAPTLAGLRVSARTATVAEYAYLTQRTQAALVFLKRMVDAYLPRPSDA